jgi:hypothetical protein
MNKVMPKFESKLKSIDITLKTIKMTFEQDIKKKKIYDAVGFTFNDFVALYDEQIKGLSEKGKFRDMVVDITNKRFDDLSGKQKNILNKISVSA